MKLKSLSRLLGKVGVRGVVGAAPLLVALACGDDSDSGANGSAVCTEPAEVCGGDPTGTWRSQDFCFDDVDSILQMQGLPPECERAASVEDAVLDTTVTVQAGTWSETGDVTISWLLRFDVACVSALAEASVSVDQIATFCDAYPGMLLSLPESPFTEMTCDVDGDVCSCDATQVQSLAAEFSFTVDGTDLVDSDGARTPFCASGSQLSLSSGPMAADGIGVTARYTRTGN